MSENEGFILKSEQHNQEEWCEMFRRVSETCKDLRTENESLQTQLQQKENIIKEVREYIEEQLSQGGERETRDLVDGYGLLEILDKVDKRE